VACAGVFSLQRYYANAMSVPARERGGVNSRKDFKGAAGYLAVRSSPGDVFVHVNEVSSLPLYYYYGRASGTGGRIFLKDAVLLFDNWFFKHRTEPRAIIEETVPHRLSVYLFGGPGAFDPQFIVRSHRVWLVYSSWDEWDARPWFTVLSENLIRDYELAETKDYDGISLSLFVRKDRRI
jgi:hypothetical protein